MYINTYIQIQRHAYIHQETYTHTYIQSYIQAYIHTYIHTYGLAARHMGGREAERLSHTYIPYIHI